MAGHKVGPDYVVYAATKPVMRALSEGLRQEVKPYNIRTTVISPGAVATELPNSVTEPDDADLPPLGFARVNKVATLYENVVKPYVHHD